MRFSTLTENETEEQDVEEKVDKLENKVERLEEKTNGKNQIRMQAYDLKIKASSEETGMREMLAMCSAEMDDLMQQALIGEYQQMEQEDLFSQLLGDD